MSVNAGSAGAPHRKSSWLGFVLVAMVATSFAAGSTLARVAYESGSNALTVLTARNLLALVVLFVLLRVQGVKLTIAPGQRRVGFVLGVLLALYSYGLYGAIEHMPVALVIVTFYTYPLIVAVAAWFIGHERASWLSALALLIAFVGLVFALDAVHGKLVSTIGTGLALMGAVVFATVILLNDKVRGEGDSRPLTLYMLVVCTAAYVIICIGTGQVAFPSSRAGWIGFAATPVFYTFSIISLFVAVRLVGPVRTALVMNFEPVASVIFGYLILGQHLKTLQLVGIGLVVAAIVTTSLQRASRGK